MLNGYSLEKKIFENQLQFLKFPHIHKQEFHFIWNWKTNSTIMKTEDLFGKML